MGRISGLLLLCCWLTAGQAGAEQVTLTTRLGDIVIELDREHAPVTVANFRAYYDSGFYFGTIFHRVIENFMIQGGGHTADMAEKPAGSPIVNESNNGLSNLRGSISMARVADPDSATSQFFINVVDNAHLDYDPGTGAAGYTVFGRVVAGMEVVDAISALPTRRNVPTEPVVIMAPDEALRLNFEDPAEGAVVSGVKLLRGWAVGKANAVDRVELYQDGELWAAIPYGARRDDVAAALPDYLDAGRAGFNSVVNYGNLSPGAHSFTVKVYDEVGRVREQTRHFTATGIADGYLIDPAAVDLSAAELTVLDSHRIEARDVRVDGAAKTLVLRWSVVDQNFVIIDAQ